MTCSMTIYVLYRNHIKWMLNKIELLCLSQTNGNSNIKLSNKLFCLSISNCQINCIVCLRHMATAISNCQINCFVCLRHMATAISNCQINYFVCLGHMATAISNCQINCFACLTHDTSNVQLSNKLFCLSQTPSINYVQLSNGQQHLRIVYLRHTPEGLVAIFVSPDRTWLESQDTRVLIPLVNN